MNPLPAAAPTDLHRQWTGGIGVAHDEVIAFPEGLPGFEACRSFVLLSSADMAPLQQLRAVAGPDASFIAIDPRCVFAEYRGELSAHDRDRLRAPEGTALLWLAIVTVDPDGTVSANLRAPIVVNPRTMTGVQVIAQDGAYALRHILTEIE